MLRFSVIFFWHCLTSQQQNSHNSEYFCLPRGFFYCEVQLYQHCMVVHTFYSSNEQTAKQPSVYITPQATDCPSNVMGGGWLHFQPDLATNIAQQEGNQTEEQMACEVRIQTQRLFLQSCLTFFSFGPFSYLQHASTSSVKCTTIYHMQRLKNNLKKTAKCSCFPKLGLLELRQFTTAVKRCYVTAGTHLSGFFLEIKNNRKITPWDNGMNKNVTKASWLLVSYKQMWYQGRVLYHTSKFGTMADT